jgi:hypothetical protein
MYFFLNIRFQVRHAAQVVFPVYFEGGEHVYRVHSMNVQLVTDLVIMPAKEEHGCDSGSESLDKHKPHDMSEMRSCRCCKRWSHTLLNSANLYTAGQFLSVHDLF